MSGQTTPRFVITSGEPPGMRGAPILGAALVILAGLGLFRMSARDDVPAGLAVRSPQPAPSDTGARVRRDTVRPAATNATSRPRPRRPTVTLVNLPAGATVFAGGREWNTATIEVPPDTLVPIEVDMGCRVVRVSVRLGPGQHTRYRLPRSACSGGTLTGVVVP